MKSFWMFCVVLGVLHLQTGVRSQSDDERYYIYSTATDEYIQNATQLITDRIQQWSDMTNNFTDLSKCSKGFEEVRDIPHSVDVIVDSYSKFNPCVLRVPSYPMYFDTLPADAFLPSFKNEYIRKRNMTDQEQICYSEKKKVVDGLSSLVQTVESKFFENCEEDMTKVPIWDDSVDYDQFENRAALEELLRETVIPKLRGNLNTSSAFINNLHDGFKKYIEDDLDKMANKVLVDFESGAAKETDKCAVALVEKEVLSLGYYGTMLSCLGAWSNSTQKLSDAVNEIEANPLVINREFPIPTLQALWEKRVYGIVFEIDLKADIQFNQDQIDYLSCLEDEVDSLEKEKNEIKESIIKNCSPK